VVAPGPLDRPAGAEAVAEAAPAETRAPEATAELTIEQLAGDTGMTVRNIRNHQSRGLLPPPEVRQRVGYYGPEHVARLRLIQDMQSDGFNLEAIKRLLSGAHGAAEQIVGMRRAVSAPFETEPPEVLTLAELGARFGGVHPRELEKAQRLGVLSPLGGDRFEAPSPGLLRAAEEVMERGVSLEAALAVVETLRRSCEYVARAFVKLFLDEVWAPYEAQGFPEERLPEVLESIERLRPIASQALLRTFELTMTREVGDAFGKQLTRLAKRGG